MTIDRAAIFPGVDCPILDLAPPPSIDITMPFPAILVSKGTTSPGGMAETPRWLLQANGPVTGVFLHFVGTVAPDGRPEVSFNPCDAAVYGSEQAALDAAQAWGLPDAMRPASVLFV